MRRLYTLALFFLLFLPLASAGKFGLFDYLPANETVELVTFECYLNCTPKEWFMVNTLIIIKPYNQTHDIKIMVTGNESRQEFIPAMNLTPFLIYGINWNNLENITENAVAYDIYGRKWMESFERMNGKIWSKGIKLQFHCSDCEVHGCLLILNINCNANATNCEVMSQVPPDCGMNMGFTKTGTQKPEDKEICGPILLVGLVLGPLLIKRIKR